MKSNTHKKSLLCFRVWSLLCFPFWQMFFSEFFQRFFLEFFLFFAICAVFLKKKTCAYFVLTTWGKRRRVLLNDVFDLGSVSVVVVVGVGVGHGGHWLLEIFEIPLKLDCSGLCCCRCCCGFLEVRGSHAVRSLYGFLTPSPSLEFYVW